MNATQFTAKLVAFSIMTADAHSAKLWLIANAPAMSDAEKVTADEAVVDALMGHYKIAATMSTRPVLSGWTFKPEKGDTSLAAKAACNCANVALCRARAILNGKASVKEQVSGVARAMALIAKKIGEGDAEAVRAAKKLILLVNNTR